MNLLLRSYGLHSVCLSQCTVYSSKSFVFLIRISVYDPYRLYLLLLYTNNPPPRQQCKNSKGRCHFINLKILNIPSPHNMSLSVRVVSLLVILVVVGHSGKERSIKLQPHLGVSNNYEAASPKSSLP